MQRSRVLILLVALCGGCAPATLPRLQVAVACGEQTGAAGQRRQGVIWLRLSWDGRDARR